MRSEIAVRKVAKTGQITPCVRKVVSESIRSFRVFPNIPRNNPAQTERHPSLRATDVYISRAKVRTVDVRRTDQTDQSNQLVSARNECDQTKLRPCSDQFLNVFFSGLIDQTEPTAVSERTLSGGATWVARARSPHKTAVCRPTYHRHHTTVRLSVFCVRYTK